MNLTAQQKSHIWLDTFGLTAKQMISLMSEVDDVTMLVKRFSDYRELIERILGAELYQSMAGSLSKEYLQQYIDKIESIGAGVLTAHDEHYPAALAELPDAPHILYYMGNPMLLRSRIVTVVGSRRCTRYGERQTEKIAAGLSSAGLTVMSGLAEGIDTVAANAALKSGGAPIAVIAGGFNKIYPKSNIPLFKRHTESGVVISESPPDCEPIPYMFPLRNRIMAAAAEATVLIEAGEKSGALITARLAAQCGRKVFALPGSVDLASSVGCNSLIKEGAAKLITGYADVLSALEIKEEPETAVQAADLTGSERQIMQFLNAGDRHIEEITQHLGIEIGEVNMLLTVLEIKGLIKKLPGNNFGV